MLLLNALVAIYALVMLARHGPRAVLYVAPRTIRIRGDADALPRTSGQVAAGELLESLGFARLGLRHERSPLGGLDLAIDAWAHPDGTCADAYPTGGRAVAIGLLTTLGDGFQVATANFKRPTAEGAAGRVEGLAGLSAENALIAHRRTAEGLAGSHGEARKVAGLEERLDLARRYYAGIGATELRRPALMSLLNSVIALALFGWSVRLALRNLGILS
jgi:hypothetical protein